MRSNPYIKQHLEVKIMKNIIVNTEIHENQIKSAEKVLIDNGIDPDEAYIVLQALGYVLLNVELYPEDI